jgi:hypothetical protein
MFRPMWPWSGVKIIERENYCLLLICKSSQCACVFELVDCVLSCCVLCWVSMFETRKTFSGISRVPTRPVTRILSSRMVGWLMNWEGYWRKWSWLKRNNIPEYLRGIHRKTIKIRSQVTSVLADIRTDNSAAPLRQSDQGFAVTRLYFYAEWSKGQAHAEGSVFNIQYSCQ